MPENGPAGPPTPPPAGLTGVLDISLPLLPGAGSVVPGDPPFRRDLFLRHAAHGCEAAAWSLSAHTGTHLDFPAHFFPGGARAGDYAMAAFFPPAVVVDCGQAMAIGSDVLAGLDTAPGEALLLRTLNSSQGLFRGSDFPKAFAAATPALARECVRRKIGLVGIDALSIEPLSDPYPVHHMLLGAGIPILEGLSLHGVRAGRFRLACPPLAVPDAEASPVRAVLWPLASERL